MNLPLRDRSARRCEASGWSSDRTNGTEIQREAYGTDRLAAALTLVAAPSAFAQSEGQKLERAERDNRDIRNDTRDIRHDKADIRSDRAELREERGERNADLRREERAIEHGHLKAAEKWNARPGPEGYQRHRARSTQG
jgi:hypothetical protein